MGGKMAPRPSLSANRSSIQDLARWTARVRSQRKGSHREGEGSREGEAPAEPFASAAPGVGESPAVAFWSAARQEPRPPAKPKRLPSINLISQSMARKKLVQV